MSFDLEKFSKHTYLTATERVAQQVDLFNANSNGVIQLIAKPFNGDFDIKASFKAIQGLVRHRDVENGQNKISSARLTQHKNVAVKTAVGTPEMLWENAQYAWTMQNPELAAITIGEQLGDGMMAHMLNTAIKAGVAALSSNTAVVEKASSTINFTTLTKGASRFGDRSSAILAWVLHSGALTQLQLNALSNNERLFSYGTVNVLRDPMGRIFIVTDSPDLMSSGNYHTLGLTESGLVINNQNDFNSIITPKSGTENITYAYQSEWSQAVSVKGYSWKQAEGGSNPNAGALATPTNWEKVASSDKDTAGVLLQTTVA